MGTRVPGFDAASAAALNSSEVPASPGFGTKLPEIPDGRLVTANWIEPVEPLNRLMVTGTEAVPPCRIVTPESAFSAKSGAPPARR